MDGAALLWRLQLYDAHDGPLDWRPIADIAARAERPDRVLGMHFFSPVEKMPLLEVIPHEGTSARSIASQTAGPLT